MKPTSRSLFHFYGGNLKSIENLMNEAIDTTYLNSGADFFPDGSTVALEKNQSIKSYIKNSKIIHDKHHRGGYEIDQTKRLIFPCCKRNSFCYTSRT